ncbi:hypothetical protein [Rhodoferax sp. PAMC 29310]|uniref:hypothetical protein n=1 Tax=Rhodoferax sp. PAMC 29310 TaxID=2822760 RepID=UPI001B31C719|nr:hypothetical protein [Rhodoferax sp. PAMC 29310]
MKKARTVAGSGQWLAHRGPLLNGMGDDAVRVNAAHFDYFQRTPVDLRCQQRRGSLL